MIPGLQPDQGLQRDHLRAHGFFASHNLAVNYHGPQYFRTSRFIDSRMTLSNCSRREQRLQYASRKSQALVALGIKEIVFDYRMFAQKKSKISRKPGHDIIVVRQLLEQALNCQL